jgi:hypothetical protein
VHVHNHTQALLLSLGKFTAVAGLAYVLVGRAVAFARTKAVARKQQQQASGSSDSPSADVSATSAAAQHKHQHIPVSEPGVMVPGLTKGRDPEVQLQEEEAAAENAEVRLSLSDLR